MSGIVVVGAGEHNLAGIDVRIPRGRLTVVTGVSGSGKSSLVFDTIGREAQRRFLETLPAFTRGFLGRLRRPSVRRLEGLSPAVVLDQRPGATNPRSTVGTMTEVWDLLRLLFARAGRSPDGTPLSRGLFSFNTPDGACPGCQGLGVADRLDPELLVADPARSLRDGALRVSTPNGYLMYSQVTLDVLEQVLAAHGGSVDTPWRELTEEQRQVVLRGSERVRVPFGKHPLESRLRWTGITPRPRQEGFYKGLLPVMETILRGKRNDSILRFVRTMPCAECGGARLRAAARAVTFHGHGIAPLAALDATGLARFFRELELAPGEAPAVGPIRAAVLERLDLLAELGLPYLTIDRPAATLSAGEAQRVRLVTLALGSLRGLLYVLDEPSVGLHPRDVGRLMAVLRRLRDAGNTVLVVDHDEAVIRGADHLVDLGPGAGENGGRLLWSGPVSGLLAAPSGPSPGTPCGVAAPWSPTRAWLTSPAPDLDRPRRAGAGELRLEGVTRNNLRDVAVVLRRAALNVVTGVSGAGKTSLLQELLARARSGGFESIDRVLEVDQSPIGRTPRSNAATYTGVSDAIRDLFAATPAARAAGLGKGAFSFNVAGGRCEACEGAGVLTVGMHFLGSVHVPCEACGGRRFRPEVLAVRVEGRSIAEVLELRVAAALELFAGQPRIARTLTTLRDLGLGYLPLGQPATTLSGGEAQRIKLAAELQRPAGRGALVALDEPTTGLHADDVAVLVAALDRLVEAGATVVVVEHDRAVLAAADRIVDLGPEGGAAGGRVVAEGTPAELAACEESHTGAALRSGRERLLDAPPEPPRPAPVAAPIELLGVRTNNLHGFDVRLPFPGLSVITGPSGSGKSSLARDTLAAEARNRFSDTVSAWARRFLPRRGAADLDEARGLTPVVEVSERSGRRNPRSTVGSVSEVAPLLRLLFARAGVRPCPACGGALEGASCACGHRLDPPPTSSSFSCDSRAAACPRCTGLGFVSRVDPARLVTHPDRPLTDGALAGSRIGAFFGEPDGRHVATLRAAGSARGFDFEVPFERLDEAAREAALRGCGAQVFDVSWRFARGKRTGVHRFRSAWAGFCNLVEEEYRRVHGDDRALEIEPLLVETTCPECAGTRLAPASRQVRFAGRTLPELAALPLAAVLARLEDVAADPVRCGVGTGAAAVTADARAEAAERLSRLDKAGLGYLVLEREMATLSAGEAQRVRLAAQLGGGLVGITYVLDEPTAGLHARDTGRMLALLRELARESAVVVVEHDAEAIAAADQVLELGPGAGAAGGRLVAQGPPAALAADPSSVTGELLRVRLSGAPRRTPRHFAPGLEVCGARLHNLQDLEVVFPAAALTVVTGVSGSGKSTLVFDVLAPALASL
ncbi:MAG: excinuclease ABC subunit UvrA, partial [Deltaproteobacteria bacterium]|nr:excinuclease ABC subunit UvrA [Deltaproteobacteria bacterium]